MKTSVKTILAQDSGFQLVHKTAGMEPAGSGMRETTESFGVIRPISRSGQWFKTREEAEARFNYVTNK